MATGLIQPPVDGEFYINNDDSDFYLREGGVWDYKGRLFRANVVGFWGEGRFNAGDVFTLAMSKTAVTYPPAFSGSQSSVTCDYAPSTQRTIVFTDDLAAYLAYGERAICTAVFAPNTKVATLTFLQRDGAGESPAHGATIAAGAPTWLVLPDPVADTGFAGLRVLIAGMPD
jgi:hypothetical protein